MNSKDIYTLDWQYDYWADINQNIPIGSVVRCKVTRVEPCYAFLTTEEGITCFLDIRKTNDIWPVKNLTGKIEIGEHFDCIVCGYDFNKERLAVSLNINQ